MDYERIEKPSSLSQGGGGGGGGGGFSPSKLRAMLLGVEKRRREEEELESRFSLRSDGGEIDDRRGGGVESIKDVDVVSSITECSASMETTGFRSRVRAQEEDSFDSESVSSSSVAAMGGFEFQRAERHRSALMPPFLKPAPSKWDDAQKWIASPNSSRQSKGGGGLQNRRSGLIGYGHRPADNKVVVEVTEEVDTKRIDQSEVRRGNGVEKSVNSAPDSYPVVDLGAKPAPMVENSAISLSRHDSSTSVHSATTIVTPPSTVRSVSMRDMGTEMTPIASQEPSRTGTPAGATTPTRSPTSSRPSTPTRTAPTSNPIDSADHHGDVNKKELSEKELKMKTRREIMMLGQQLGKTNIAAWASKEEEETDSSISLKTLPLDQPAKNVIETCAAAWEEAEKAKYLARFKREEIKIEAWENHQKAKTEAEMRKIEVEVERMRARAHDKLMNELAAARYKAEEKRAAAEAKRNQQAAKTAEQAETMRRTGRIPSSFSCWGWCS